MGILHHHLDGNSCNFKAIITLGINSKARPGMQGSMPRTQG